MSFDIRPLCYCEPEFAELIAEAGSGDGRFLFRLRDHWLEGSEIYDRSGEILLGAFSGDELVGVAGISKDPYEPEENLGRVRHVYVMNAWRGRGIARALMERLLEHGSSHFQELRLRTSNPLAARMYESLGFKASAQGGETHRLKLYKSSTRRP